MGETWDVVSFCLVSMFLMCLKMCLWEKNLAVRMLKTDIQYSDIVLLHFVIVQMTVTWTSGYNIGESVPFVEWGAVDGATIQSPAATFTYTRNQMCGMLC